MPGKIFIQINKPSMKQDSVLCWAFDCAGLFYLPRLCLDAMAGGHGIARGVWNPGLQWLVAQPIAPSAAMGTRAVVAPGEAWNPGLQWLGGLVQ